MSNDIYKKGGRTLLHLGRKLLVQRNHLEEVAALESRIPNPELGTRSDRKRARVMHAISIRMQVQNQIIPKSALLSASRASWVDRLEGGGHGVERGMAFEKYARTGVPCNDVEAEDTTRHVRRGYGTERGLRDGP